VKDFKDRNTDITNRLHYGRPRTAATECNEQNVDELNKLNCVLCEKCPKKKTVILQHDIMKPHNAHPILQTIQKNCWELLPHPPYSPDVAPSDNHLFGPLKYHLRGHLYETGKAV
jgi:histone-lysine N-methyltransferase SETMAR